MQPPRWTDDQVRLLRMLASLGLSAAWCARAVERTRAATYAKASELEIRFTGAAAEVERALDDGVPLVRDVVAGHGFRWAPASRSGEIHPDSNACEALLALGYLKPTHGDTYVKA